MNWFPASVPHLLTTHGVESEEYKRLSCSGLHKLSPDENRIIRVKIEKIFELSTRFKILIAGALKESGTTRLVMLEYKDGAINLTSVSREELLMILTTNSLNLACHVENNRPHSAAAR
jgi:hypothetical protein